MAYQSPTISIPKKTTEEVDWTTPIRNLIAQSYGENPDNYSSECASLQRCRQDAVRGAGSDMTARDLLYKYFGQLELLELRFAEIRVTFPWHDAFTNKLTTQTSLAFEKASIIFQIAATHSSIAVSQNRSDPEGLKRAYTYFRTCAGMLSYINENFLHAPSTDLSKEVVKFLVSIVLAQATEVMFEKVVDEKKTSVFIAKIAAQTAAMYSSLNEEVKEFMGKGIFDRNWVTIIQIKSKYFLSLSHLYRAYADNAAGKHGDALARFAIAESAAKEASRNAASFGAMFMTQMSPNLPADAGSSIQELTKVHHTLCTEKKAEAQRDNDLIYNAVVPPADTLPSIDKIGAATPVPIQEVYGTPDVQKTIGPDLFVKLIPLSVHESASVYSEEKAKLVRAETERAETADIEVRSAIDSLGVKDGLGRYRAMVAGLSDAEELPSEVSRMRGDVALVEEQEPVARLLAELARLKDAVREELDSVQRELEIESRECEAGRVKYEHHWTQSPSAPLTKGLRADLKSHFTALEAAAASDGQVQALWESMSGDVGLLLSNRLEGVFRQNAEEGPGGSLLDLDPRNEDRDEEERRKISSMVDEIEERLGRLNKIASERKAVLKDLKDKIQTDDVSHLLLLNRRNSSVEPTLFAAELEKFKPYQSRLAATRQHEQVALQEITQFWKGLKDFAGRGPGARKWDEREKRKKDLVRRFLRARDGYNEVRDGLAKGLQFYHDLSDLAATLRRNVKSFVTSRSVERDTLIAQAEAAQRQHSASSAPPPLADKPPRPPPPLPSSPNGLHNAFSSMSLHSPSSTSSPPPPPSQMYSQFRSPPPPPAQQQQFNQSQSPSTYGMTYSSSLPPPPPPQQPSSPPAPPAVDPYSALFNAPWATSNSAAPPPPAPQSQPQAHYGNMQQQQQQFTRPTYTPQQQGFSSQSPYQSYGQSNSSNPLPPPPPPMGYQSYQPQYGSSPAPQQTQQSQNPYQTFQPSQPNYQGGQANYGR
ncbi:BRO1-domain-containing protein [Rickenella mellea]|uniref:BRO domain-containing protein 1 n=1 Tax=Rickenella mellea TaxID=50990 RepID=A0A4Y7QJG3_9AGAM|nr:BRO1-domain-containing protein [Rickenella mellea]